MTDEEAILLAKAKLMGVTITGGYRVSGKKFYRLDAPPHLRFASEFIGDDYAIAKTLPVLFDKLQTLAPR